MYKIYAYSHSEQGFKSRAFCRDCQDANNVVCSEKTGRVVVSIADGVSDAKYGKEGAEVNVVSGCKIMLAEGIGVNEKILAKKIYNSVYQKATNDYCNVEIREFAATYAGIIAERDGGFSIASVGDSLILGKTSGGEYRVLMTPMNKDNDPCRTYCNYELNRFRTDDNPLIIRKHSINSMERYVAIFLFTDGAGDHFCSKETDPRTSRMRVMPVNTNELDQIIDKDSVGRAKLIDEMCQRLAFPDRRPEVENLLENLAKATTDEEANIYENTLKSIWPHDISVGGDDATIGCIIFDEDVAVIPPYVQDTVSVPNTRGSIDTVDSIDIGITTIEESGDVVPARFPFNHERRTNILPTRKVDDKSEKKSPEQMIKPELTKHAPSETRFDTAEKIKRHVMKEEAPIGIRLYMVAIDN